MWLGLVVHPSMAAASGASLTLINVHCGQRRQKIVADLRTQGQASEPGHSSPAVGCPFTRGNQPTHAFQSNNNRQRPSMQQST